MNFWLMKTEPDTFSIDSLKNAKNSTSSWDGIRNYQARNFMRDQMRRGDKVFIYHSSCKNIGIAGIATVVKESYPDHTSWDPKGAYFDPKSNPETPRWFMVDIKWQETFKEIIPLSKLKETHGLESMILLKKGNRLSITPITYNEFQIIKDL